MNLNSVSRGTPAPHLDYYGGKVLTHPRFVSLYYGNYWQSAAGTQDRTRLDSFANFLMGSRYMSLWREYGGGPGTVAPSQTLAPSTQPKQVSEQQIEALLKHAFKAGAITPAPETKGDQTVYTVFLPPGAVLSTEGASSLEGVGGYHSSFQLARGQKVYYSVIVYSKGRNGIDFTGTPTDNMSITSSHEWTEAVTDPDVNHGKLGWYDERYGEVGDIPINIGLPLRQIYGRLSGWAVQKEWSNADKKSELWTKSASPS